MGKNLYDFLLNGNGEKFNKKNQQINISDRVFNWVETVKKPMKEELKIEYKGQKYNSYSSKESKHNFREWKKSVFKDKKRKLKIFLKNELNSIKKGKIIKETNSENSEKLFFSKRQIFNFRNNYKSFTSELQSKKTAFLNIHKFFIWNKVQNSKNSIKDIIELTNEQISNASYEDQYKYKINKCYYETGSQIFGEYFQLLKDNIKNKEKIQAEFKNAKKISSSKIKNKIKEIKNEKHILLKNLRNKSSIEKMKRNVFKNEKNAISRDIKFKKKLIKAKKPFKKMCSSKIENFFDIKRKKSALFKSLKSELLDIHKKTPYETTNKKYIFFLIIGSIFPGTSEFFQKRWGVAFWKLAVSIIIVSLILPWVFGAFPSNISNGIIGLKNFGAKNGHLLNGNDSRFYLVTGTLAVLMLFVSLSYFIIFGAININNTKKLKLGLRSPRYSKFITPKNLPYFFTSPAIIFIMFIVVLPLLASLFISFTNYNQKVNVPGGTFHFTNGATIPFEWVGFEQFKYIIQIVGKDFSKVLLWTLIWTFGSTLLTLFIGTFFAIIVNQKRIVGKGLIRVIYILPWAIPGFVTVLFFSIIFNESGIFNETIGKHLFGRNIDWKNEVNYEKVLLIFMQMWLGQSYIFILITGMIQSIPKDLYESSKIDGSSDFNNFRKITMPIVVKAILPLLIGQFVGNFNNFNIIYLFNEGGPTLLGNTVGETDIFISWIYDLINGGGATQRPAAGAALSFMVSIFVVTPSALVYFKSKSFRERA